MRIMKKSKPVYVLGIHKGHTATAALLRDGALIACVSEERFTGIKNFLGFPQQSIQWVLSFAGITGKDLDLVVLPYTSLSPKYVSQGERSDPSITLLSVLFTIVASVRSLWGRIVYQIPKLRPVGQFFYSLAGTTIGEYTLFKERQFISGYLRIPIEKIVKFDHHLTHASTAYYASPFNEKRAVAVTLDAEGDGNSSTVTIFHGPKIDRITQTKRDHSLGLIYSFVTKYLGMKPGEHEYKVMGLAPYAKEKQVNELYETIKNFITIDPFNPLRFTSRLNTQDTYRFLKKHMEGVRFDYIAGAFQKLVEERMIELVRNALSYTKCDTLVAAGGVFMNVKANQRISELLNVKHAFFMPSAGDESLAIGACYLGYRKHCMDRNKKFVISPLKDLYLGSSFTDVDVKQFLSGEKYKKKYHIKHYDNIEKEIAGLLTKGKVVACIAGRMEWGARALGNRSIMAHPKNYDVVRDINERMKMRDFWMPFAPSILYERRNDYCDNPKAVDAPYMTITFESTPRAREELRAAMHPYDFTLRPQFVRKEWNERYWTIIKEFEKLTGIGGILNTSFNLHGYPIVMGPKEAMYAFENSGLEYLALENYLITKK